MQAMDLNGHALPDPDWVAHVDGEERDAMPSDQPTADDPLCGLEHLGKIAVVGRAALVELSEREIDYVWAPVASLGWIIMLAGPPGLGKTTELCQIVVARANTGKPIDVLGLTMQPAPRGRFIVFVEGEVDEIATPRKLRGTCRMRGVDESALDRVVLIARKGLRVGDPAWGDIERMIAAGIVSDIALDSVARVSPRGADTNDEAAQTALFDAIATAVDRAPSPDSKPVVWLVAHTRKGGDGGLDDVLGSRARTAQVDSLILLSGEKHNGRVLNVTATFEKLRHDVDEHPAPVTVTIDRDPATRELRYALGGVVRDERPLEAQIETLLERHPEGLTKSRIADELRRSRVDIQGPIDTLFAAGRLAGAKVQVGKRTYSGVRLRTENRGGRPSSAWEGGRGTRTEADEP